MGDVITMIQSVAPDRIADAKFGSTNILIRCPYHKGGQEKTPSLSVKLDAPVFFCHACKENGHLTKLLTKLGMPKDLARSSVDNTVFADTGTSHRIGSSRWRLYPGGNPYRGKFILDDDFLDDYRLMPVSLREAGFEKRTLRHFDVGFDTSRLRITYPLRNIFGELVGVSGRTVIGEEPRYKIYRSELVSRGAAPLEYDLNSVKKGLLWHGHAVIPILFKDRDLPIIITEGFKAAMWTWQSGYNDVVALTGSYLTDEHANLLSVLGCPVILFLDNNEAGITGTYKAIRKITNSRVSIARYPDLREQPDDLDPHEVEQAIQTAQTSQNWIKENKNVIRQTTQRTWR